MAAAPRAGSDRLRRLVKRSEFLRAARGKRAGRDAVSLQAVPSEGDLPGIGFTVTKKVGNAPERNRIRRRLREAVRSCAGSFHTRHDYVLVARREALSIPYRRLVGDIESLLSRIHRNAPAPQQATEPAGSGSGQRTR